MPKKAVEVKGLKELISLVNNMTKDQREITEKTFRNFGSNTVNKINSRTPVKTGRLKKGNRFKMDSPTQLRILNPVHYAPHVNFGTSRMPERPFFTQTIEEETPKLIQELNKQWGKKIKFRLRK